MPTNDFISTLARDSLLERLRPMVVEARTVVDVGTGPGSACRALARRFRGAQIIGVDLSRDALREARRRKPWLARHSFVRADAAAMPFADRSVDVVFTNLLLPWIEEPALIFSEFARILREGGLCAFSALGPVGLPELCQADMHDIGDAAVRAGLRDPVLDVERQALSYATRELLATDLADLGAPDAAAQRIAGETANGDALRLELELVYGHCWGADTRARDGAYRIDPAQITRR